MNEVLRYIGEALRRTYDSIVERPMPWRVIDKLASLEEKCEQEAQGDAKNSQPNGAAIDRPSPAVRKDGERP